jgi:hypothetical protein
VTTSLSTGELVRRIKLDSQISKRSLEVRTYHNAESLQA